jgi:hypothetical protein
LVVSFAFPVILHKLSQHFDETVEKPQGASDETYNAYRKMFLALPQIRAASWCVFTTSLQRAGLSEAVDQTGQAPDEADEEDE